MRYIKILIVLIIASCQSENNLSPKETVSSYLRAQLEMNNYKAHSHLSKIDRTSNPVSDSKEDSDFNKLMIMVNSKSSFQILNEFIEADTCYILVEHKYLDFTEIENTIPSKILESKNNSEILPFLKEYLKSDKLNFSTDTNSYMLILENKKWKIRTNTELFMSISSKLDKIKELKSNFELESAIQELNQILNISNLEKALPRLHKKVNHNLNLVNNLNSYIDSIEIYEVNAKYYDSYSDGRIPGIIYKIKNNGSSYITKLQLKIYFYNSEDTIIHEEEISPIIVISGDNSYLGDEPLKPDYIWTQGKNRFTKFRNVPNEWKEGSIKVKIRNLELRKS